MSSRLLNQVVVDREGRRQELLRLVHTSHQRHVELEPVILDDSQNKYFGKYKQSHIVHLKSQNKLSLANPISIVNMQDDEMLREITEINERVEESIGQK